MWQSQMLFELHKNFFYVLLSVEEKRNLQKKPFKNLDTEVFFFSSRIIIFGHYCSEGSEILSWNVKKSWKSCKWKIWIYEIFLMIIIVSLCLIGKKIFICNTRTVGFLVLSAGGKSRIVLCHLWIIFALI